MEARPKKTLRVLALLAGLSFVAALWALHTHAAWEGACTLARRQLPGLLGLELGINSCELEPLTQTVKLRGVSGFLPGSEVPLFAADEVEVSIRALLPPYSVRLGKVRVVRPRVTVDLRQPSPSPAKSQRSCPLEVFKHLRIDHLDIKGARLELLLPLEQSVSLAQVDVGWSVRRGITELQADARQGSVTLGPGRELLISKLSIEGGVDLGDEQLQLTRAELTVDESTLSLSGKIDELCDPSLSIEGQLFLPLSTLARAEGSTVPTSGQLWSRFSLGGKPTSPEVRAETVGTGLGWGERQIGDFTAGLTYSGDEVNLTHFSAPAGGGKVKATGTLRLVPKLPLKLKLETENAQLAPILAKAGLPGAWVDFPASLKGTFAGTLLPAPRIFGDAEIHAGRFILQNQSLDESRVTAADGPRKTLLTFPQGKALVHVGVLPDRVELSSIKVDLPGHGERGEGGEGGTHVEGDVTLFYDTARGMMISGHADPVDLSDFGHLAGQPWAGRGSARFSIQGSAAELQIQSQINLREFEFDHYALGVFEGPLTYHAQVLELPGFSGQKGRTSYHGAVKLSFLPTGLEVSGTMQVPSGHSSDLVDIVAGLSPSIAAVQDTIEGDASGSVTLNGPISRIGGTIAFDLRNTTYYERRLGDGRLQMRLVKGESLVLDRTVLQGPMGTTSVQGTYSFEGPLDYRFRLDGGSLAEVVGAERAKGLGVSGALTVVGKVGGDSTTPVVEAYLTSPQVSFAGKPLGTTHLEARVQGKDAQLWGQLFDDAKAQLKFKIKDAYPFEGSLTLALPEIRPLLPDRAAAQGVSGSLAGTAQASGNLADLSHARVTARLTQLALSRGDFSGQNQGPIVLSYAGGRVGVESFAFKGPNTELVASGFYGPQTMDCKMTGAFDMRLLESFVPSIERTGGRVELSAEATGPVAHPALIGTAEIHDARLSMRDQPVTLRALSGRVDFSEARVLVTDVFGVLNEGRLSVRGDVRLHDFDIKDLELNFGLEEVSYRLTDDLPVTASGELLLAGKPGAFQLSGGLDIIKLRYDRPLALDSLLRQVKDVQVGGSAEQPKEWLRFDVDVAASGDVRIDNNLARAKLGGKLKVTGTNLRPGLLGTIEAAAGSQAFFRGNQFAVSKGELEFKDRSSIDAYFDLNAQTQVREYLVTLKAFGRLSEPKVLLTSDPALSETDVLSLLTLGVTSRDRAYSTQTSASLAAEALFQASGLDRQVQRFLPKNALLRDLSFHLSTTYNEITGQVEPTAQLESKLLTDQLKLGMTKPVLGRGTGARLEYQFNDKLSGRAQWDNEGQDYSFGNPGLDLKFRLEWE